MRGDDEDMQVWKRQFDKGSLVDFFLTENQDFSNIFKVVENVNPPKKNTQSWKFNNALINQSINWENPIYDYNAAYETAEIKSPRLPGFESPTKEEFIQHFDYSWLRFYEEKMRLKSQNIEVVLKEDVEEAKQLVLKLINLAQPNVSKYFINIPNIYETYGQVEIYGDLNGCPVKIKIDRLCFDMVNKTALILDVKTTEDYSSNFQSSYDRFNYDIQADFYHKVYREAKITNCNYDLSKYKKFNLLNYFDFLVIPKNQSNPMLYRHQVRDNEKVEKGINMYKTLIDNNLIASKQSYYDYTSSIEGFMELKKNDS